MPRPISRPTDKPVQPRLDAMLRGYMRNQQAEAKTKEEGVVNTLADSLVARGVVPESPALRVGALAGDMAADPLNFVPGLGLVVTGLGDAGRLSAMVRRLNKSDDVRDFVTRNTVENKVRPNDPNEGLYRPGAQSFDYKSVPEPASPYTFGLVQTEKLAPLREFDRMAEPAGQKVFGPDNVKKLMDILTDTGKLEDPLAVLWDPRNKWGYLGEGNHRLAAAQQLGLEKLPTTVWRSPDTMFSFMMRQIEDTPGMNAVDANIEAARRIRRGQTPEIGKKFDIDTNQLRRDEYGDFSRTVGDYYVPPYMHPYLFKYLRPE